MEAVTNADKSTLENQEEEIYFNFINSLKSPFTKESYDLNIKLYLEFCNLNKLSELLTIVEPQKQIIKYIMSLRERGLPTSSINTMLYAIYHFYDMNDIILNKKKINSFKGESARKVTDRAYNYEEIQKILNVSDLRMKVIVLLMASAGLRVGAITELKLRNLEKIESCYKVTVYEGTNEQYYSFCTPECSNFVDSIRNIVEPYLDTDTMTPKNKSSEQMAQELLKSFQSSSPIIDSSIIRQNKVTVGGNDGQKIEYMLGDMVGDYYNFAIYTTANGKLYHLYYREDPLKVPETLPLVNKMVESFKVIK